ncbi:hypothetical protein [Pseudomonas sp.]|uniref:hypothetical protein n=1 Tax=Pseudomonas sp. TaxID=306 RepID=UPI002CEBEC35|nr:hypothetical protein [Pseudomonas sp.]HUE93176.1 hypothetical protein [Pseudomonas sp.]
MKKLVPQRSGGYVDNQLTAKTTDTIRRLGGNFELLIERISYRIGVYRDFRRAADTEPQVGVAVEHLQALGKTAWGLYKDIDQLPMHADALVWEEIRQAGGDAYLSLQQLQQGLVRLGAVLNSVAGQLTPYENKPGRKSSSLEHSLLSEVAAMIEDHVGNAIGKVEIAGLAAELLRESGVHGLPGKDKARKAVLAWRRKLAVSPE